MRARQEGLLKGGFRCLLLANAVSVPLGLFLSGFSLPRAALGLFPVACVFVYLPLRCRALRLEMEDFLEYLEEE